MALHPLCVSSLCSYKCLCCLRFPGVLPTAGQAEDLPRSPTQGQGHARSHNWAVSPCWTHPLFKSKPLQSCDHPGHLSHALTRATHFPWLKGTPALHHPQDSCTAWIYKGAWLYFLYSSLFPSSSHPAFYLFWLWSSIKLIFLQNYSLQP